MPEPVSAPRYDARFEAAWLWAKRNLPLEWIIKPHHIEGILTAGAEGALEAFTRSFDIECPECGRPPGACCMNLGSAGGMQNHSARIEAAALASDGSGVKRDER